MQQGTGACVRAAQRQAAMQAGTRGGLRLHGRCAQQVASLPGCACVSAASGTCGGAELCVQLGGKGRQLPGDGPQQASYCCCCSWCCRMDGCRWVGARVDACTHPRATSCATPVCLAASWLLCCGSRHRRAISAGHMTRALPPPQHCFQLRGVTLQAAPHGACSPDIAVPGAQVALDACL